MLSLQTRAFLGERHVFPRLHSAQPDLSIRDGEDCLLPDPANTLTDRANSALNSSGPGYVLNLCPGQQYLLQAPLQFAAPNQEITTLGQPTDSDRALLIVNGPVANGEGHTVAVDGTCANCSGVKLRYVQIDGTRNGAAPTIGGGNIEMGGPNSDQVIEFVHSYNPRSWSCLHVAEGSMNCNNAIIQNNDLGPCGVDTFQEWADGISLSCRNAVVRNNTITGATDGGIVIFGSPGSQVYNNTIQVGNQTLLGGINMVDYDPWNGDYTGTVVRDNTILGGFATDTYDGDSKGANDEDAILKIGIAIGPRTWFGDRYGSDVVNSGVVQNNRFSGAFSYAIALTSARKFTVMDNVLFGNTSFIGSRGPNCTNDDQTPTPTPFVLGTNLTDSLTTQSDFQVVADSDSLTCVLPPDGGDYWPYGGNPTSGSSDSGGSGSSAGRIAGIVVGVVGGVLILAVVAWFVRRWALKRAENRRLMKDARRSSYFKQLS